MATDTLLDEARDLLDDAVKLRRTLHRQPEIGLELPFAQERVVEALDGLPLDVTRGRSTTSVTAMLTGSRPGPTIVLRGDMDALPMPEDTGVDFASTVNGAMHACGHDLHTSMLAGAARVLSARRAELAGRVLFMFQPGEEGQHGARYMLDDGLLDVGAESPVDNAFALHVTTMLPSGFVGLKAARCSHRPTFCGSQLPAGGPRVDALCGARPHPCRLRDRAGDPDDDHAPRRRVRPAVVTVAQMCPAPPATYP